MKTLLLLFFIGVNIFSFGQDFSLKVKINPDKQNEMNTYGFKNQMIILSQKYNSNGFHMCYPNAKNHNLSLFYTFKGKGIKNDIIKDFNDFDIFESIIEEDSVCIASCTNPEPAVNDTWIVLEWANNYALELIEANCAWSISKGNSNILIGIADTEFELNHEDLENQIVSIEGQSTANSSHGTAVAGAACAETNNDKGVASIGYNSKIAAHRIPHWISNDQVYADPSDIQEAIWDLYLDGIKIINVSWTGTGLDTEAAEEITNNGSSLILAAGNTPNSTYHSTIANIPGVLVVSSVNSDNEHGPTGHAHNQWIDICAPGDNVTTTRVNNTYGGSWGTSFAAPIVSGTISLMLEVNPCLSPS